VVRSLVVPSLFVGTAQSDGTLTVAANIAATIIFLILFFI
jgi:hypothetical protein